MDDMHKEPMAEPTVNGVISFELLLKSLFVITLYRRIRLLTSHP